MKIAIVQSNPIPGDFIGNREQILRAIQEASKANVDLLVTPELGIPGYLCRDAMLTEGFVEQNLRGIQAVCNASSQAYGMTIVVGYVEQNTTGVGKPFFNSAAVIRNGTVIANYRKHLLPFYDVFDEGRYFEPGRDLTVVEICGQRFALCVCEDFWNDKKVEAYRYEDNPVGRYRAIGVNNFISLNSSPYVFRKPLFRQQMINEISRQSEGIIIYCNQIGGMDDLVFDGNSMISVSGTTLYRAGDKEGLHIVDTSKGYGFQSCTLDSYPELRKYLVLGLRDYIRKSGFREAVVASSGGIDSALVLCLACDAIGPENVHAIRMPGQYSSKGSVDDALELHNNLGCHDYLMPINNETFLGEVNRSMLGNTTDGKALEANIAEYRKIADENIQARLRAINLMHVSNAWNFIALTTSNKSESAVGYCTLGGDCMGGFAPIQDLYKMQVYQIAQLYADRPTRIAAHFEAIPLSIINKAPSAELAPNQTDEASLLPYDMLDLIICGYVEHGVSTLNGFKRLGKKEFASIFGDDSMMSHRRFIEREDADTQFRRIIKLIDRAEFKRRQVPPGIKVSQIAFGTGRRFPIVRGRWS